MKVMKNKDMIKTKSIEKTNNKNNKNYGNVMLMNDTRHESPEEGEVTRK